MDRLLTLKLEIVPLLRTYARINVWVPECGEGETAYALGTLFRELRLWPRVRIYATDASDSRLQRARDADGPDKQLLREQIVFAQHHLDTDASFNEFALIYVPEGGTRRHPLYDQSLCRLGLLSPGEPHPDYRELCPGFYRKVR
jgi:hypothetical protein